jgi:predicted permease
LLRSWDLEVDLRVLRQDLTTALRGFRRTPAFLVATVLILAFGIGTAVAMFTVFRAVLVRRLPVVEQDRVAVMWTYREPGVEFALGTGILADVFRASHTIQDVAGVAHWPAAGSPWLDGDRSITLNRSLVTGNFFDVLGVQPVLGRLLRPSDDDVGEFRADGTNSSKVIVLSYSAWRNRFGGDESIVGRRLVEPFRRFVFTVVGVAPPGLDYPAGVEYWSPIWGGWQSGVSSIAVARLKPGVTLAAARDEYFALSARLAPEQKFKGVSASTFTETVLGNVTPVLTLLTAAVGLLLLIACLNVGNLLLLRAAARRREIAVRRALGASYGDIVRQLFVESAVLAVLGGACGFAVAAGLLKLLVRFSPPQLPRLDDVALAGSPVLVAIATTSVAVLLFGMLPALLSARGDLAAPLRGDSRSGAETRRRRSVRQVLVVSQVSLATVMLGGALLLTRSLQRLQTQDLGYTSDHLSVLTFTYNATRYDSLSQLVAWGEQVMERVRALPGVTGATPVLIPPLLGTSVWHLRFDKEGQTEDEAAANPTVPVETAGAEFFRVFDIPIVRGRAFSAADREGAPLVTIVSESVARRFWPGEDAIGKRIRLRPPATGTPGEANWRTVVGIVHDNRLRDIRSTAPAVYLPWHQGDWQPFLAIRSATPLSTLLPAIARAAHEINPENDLSSGQTMDQLLAAPLAQPRFSAALMSGFGVVALLLAAAGLFGVMSAIVGEQTREFGIRMALGAMPDDVRRTVLARALMLTLTGAAIGLAGAIAISRLLTGLLFEISPVDPVSLGVACGVLVLVGLLAAYLPARRATRIDPVHALRAD